MKEVRAELGRQCIAQNAKKLALAAVLCRLAVGSGNDEKFERQLKKMVKVQNDENQETLAIISGDVGDADGEAETILSPTTH